MTEQVHTITDLQQQVAPPPPRGEYDSLIQETDAAIAYLTRFSTNKDLDTDFRMGLTEIVATLKTLKHTVKAQAKTANDNHTRIVEMAQAQRLIGS